MKLFLLRDHIYNEKSVHVFNPFLYQLSSDLEIQVIRLITIVYYTGK